MKVISILAVLCVSVLSISAAPRASLTQATAQVEFDEAIGKADRVVVAWVLGYQSTSDPILTLTSREEIAALSTYFQLRVPKLEENGLRSIGCGCYGQFDIQVFVGDALLLKITTKHGTSIYCERICEDETIDVDEQKLAPFLERLVELLPDKHPEKKKLMKKRANQALQTTPVMRSGSEKTIVFGCPQRGV